MNNNWPNTGPILAQYSILGWPNTLAQYPTPIRGRSSELGQREVWANWLKSSGPPKSIIKPFPGKMGRMGWHKSTVEGVSLSLLVGETYHVNSIRVEPALRGQGVGTVVMLSILAAAAVAGKPVTLIAKADHAKDQRRLTRWYRSLGFAWQGQMMYCRPPSLNDTPTRCRASQGQGGAAIKKARNLFEPEGSKADAELP